MVSGCCCKEVYRYFPYSTCITSFFGSSIPTSLLIFKNVFSVFSSSYSPVDLPR